MNATCRHLNRPAASIMVLFLVFFAGCKEQDEEVEGAQLNKGPTYRAFEAAAIELDVPINILMAIGYEETGWEMVTGQSERSIDPSGLSWGVMGLAEGRNLERAASTIDADLNEVRHDLSTNVRAAAALLSVIAANTLGPDYAERAALGDWRDVVANYSGFSDPETAIEFVEMVMECVRDGAGRVLDNGEIIELQGVGDAAFEQAYGDG